jgi:subtilisin family serine protease
LVFFATGNESASRIAFPANMSETIAIGASTNEGKRSGYSNFGPELDFLAPSSGGTRGIFTTDLPYPNRGFNIGRPGQGDPEGFFTNSFGGTSSATPLAAGICALLLRLKPELSVNEVRKILRQSCEKIDQATTNYDSNGFSITHGYGRINAKRTLDLVLS